MKISLLLASLCLLGGPSFAAESKPNIVYILADDLGYGDVRAYNPQSKIPTPNLDRLAAEGIRFTDAHAPDAVCTPTRYGLLTGRYAFRSRLKSGVLSPWDAPLIEDGRLTVPALLRQHGYATTCIGKWHLGWSWPTKDGQPPSSKDGIGNVDFTKTISSGPVTRGFDTYFGVDLPNFPPYCFIANDRTVGIPSLAAPMQKGGFNRPGPMVAGWNLTNIMPEITTRAVRCIEDAAKSPAKPFFLYFPLTAPHYPVVPAPEFKGRSQAGDYGDFVAQVDWTVGEVMSALARTGLATNTLVIFTSDNGPEVGEVEIGAYDRINRYGHRSMAGLRGVKRDAWEGGHRVPFIARWPDHVPAGAVSAETICHVDLMATCAVMVGGKLPTDGGEDSWNILPALLGQKLSKPIREATVLHSANGNLAIRQGDWVLIDARSGDGNHEPDWFKQERGYQTNQFAGELYNLRDDLTQSKNLYGEKPEMVQHLKTLLEKYKAEGRSAPLPAPQLAPQKKPSAKASAGTVPPPQPFGPLPTARQLRSEEMEFYGFLHFTVNTFTDREWGLGGEEEKVFNPTDFDAAQIVSAAKAAGMKGLILTAKHHDGFCLWPSRFTEHSVKNSPWKNGKGDVVKEISTACRKQGLKFGVYLSPWDRNHKSYGQPEYVTEYRNQLRELLTNYGDIFEVWLDGANGGDGFYGGANETRTIDGKTYYDWANTFPIVRELQPMACIFSDAGPDLRWVGNERGVAGDTCWATINSEGRYAGGSSKGLNSGERPGTDWIPAECDVSIRPGWFYHVKEDNRVKTPEKLVEIYYQSVGRGANLNLNLPPDRRGQIHENDVASLREFRRILDATFAKDLSRGAKLTASNTRGGAKQFAPKNLLDHKRDTYWATDDNVTTPELILDLGKPVTFNVVNLREYLPLGQRVEAFALDQWKDGQWVEFANGTSIGNRRLVRGEFMTTDKVRLRITQASVCPALSEVGLFCEPAAFRAQVERNKKPVAK